MFSNGKFQVVVTLKEQLHRIFFRVKIPETRMIFFFGLIVRI